MSVLLRRAFGVVRPRIIGVVWSGYCGSLYARVVVFIRL